MSARGWLAGVGMLLAVTGWVYAQNLEVTGTILVSKPYNRDSVCSYNMVTREFKWITQGETPTFSPDGKKIAFKRGKMMYTANNDGTEIRQLCEQYEGGDNLNWCTDGYIYWAENTNNIYRVNVATATREIYWANPNIAGYGGSNKIEDMTVSVDGTYGTARGSGSVSLFNLKTKQFINWGPWGCSGWISPNGDRIAHPMTAGFNIPGATSYCHAVAIERATDRSHEFLLWAPNQPYGPEQARVGDFRWAKNNNDYTLGIGGGEINTDSGMVVYNVTTGDWKAFPRLKGYWGNTMWIGQLPSPTATSPVIAVVPAQLSFASAMAATPVSQSVNVTNSGAGTLTAVQAQSSQTWCNVTPGGAGNSQTLQIAIVPGVLTEGVHTATVTVSATGATNSATIAVTFTYGSALRAPSGLTAVVSGADVALSWTDNSDNETGFAIERKADGGSWQEIARTQPGATSRIDQAVPVGGYLYRVRAFNASDNSAYTEEYPVSIAAVGAITLTSPVQGTVWTPGSTQQITWTSQNISAVWIQLSLDNGDTWIRLNTTGALFSDASNWQNFSFAVPLTYNGTALVQVVDYNDPDIYAESPLFEITATSVLMQQRLGYALTPAVYGLARSANGGFTVSLAAGSAFSGSVQIATLGGQTLGVVPVVSPAGVTMVSWNGYAPAVAGTYVVRLVENGGRGISSSRVFVVR